MKGERRKGEGTRAYWLSAKCGMRDAGYGKDEEGKEEGEEGL